jgi:stearoyl-CoA desaturase (delta-9 desaturase)
MSSASTLSQSRQSAEPESEWDRSIADSAEDEWAVIPVADPIAELPPLIPTPGRLSLAGRIWTFLGITTPLLGLAAAGFLLWGWGFHWTDLGLLLGMYVATVLGITVGFHRLFTHRSFETNVVVKFVLAVLGSMAVQGRLFKWVGLHRRHHQHSDTPADVHSPHHGGGGARGFLLGFWHAHIGWAFQADPPGVAGYTPDLRKSRALRAADALFPVWVALGLVIPGILGGLISGTWQGALTGVLWGGLVRIFLVHHVTWSINSACHLWGMRPYASGDQSRDNVVFGVLAMGEGWHNTHHAFPTSARHGLRWWQPDVSYWVIRALAVVGLARNLKLPSKAAQAAGRR